MANSYMQIYKVYKKAISKTCDCKAAGCTLLIFHKGNWELFTLR
jgi:hypothetical protein